MAYSAHVVKLLGHINVSRKRENLPTILTDIDLII